jgi:twinkle protein
MSKYSELVALGIPLKKNTGTAKTICPKCSHTRKKTKDPCLSVDIDNGLYHCHNCEWKGGVFIRPEKVYVKPIWNENHTNLPMPVVEWFKGRGIKQETLVYWKIGSQVEWMPQTQAKARVIAFNYFLNGVMINAKFRSREKHFRMIKDAKLIFYGLDTIKDFDQPVIICEGEMDALTIWQSGYTQVLSVPNGATKGGNLEYLDNCYDLIDPVKRFIIWVDNDEAGHQLKKELIRRLGEERCDVVTSKAKDANDTLTQLGELEVAEAIKSAKPAKLSGIIHISDIQDEIKSLYENGLPKGDETGIPEFDKLLTFEPYRVTTVTGVPSHGKSEFIDFILARLVCYKSWRVAYYSPENYPRALHVSKIIEKIGGKRFGATGVYGDRQSYEVVCAVRDFMQDKYWFVRPENEDFSVDSILIHAKKLVSRYGLRCLVIDPYNKLEHNIERGETETVYISRFMDKLTAFAQNNQVHIFLIAHPTKMQENDDGTFKVPTLYNISGSAHFFNKTDNGITVYRNFDAGTTSVYVQKVKFKHIGKTGVQDFFYDLGSGRYWIGSNDMSNWLPKYTQSQLMPNDAFLGEIHHSSDSDPLPF